MKTMLNNLILLAVILSSWIVYDQWEIFSHFYASARNKISTQFASTFSSDNADNVTTTTVYRWQNKAGEWQFSNTKPAHVPDAEIQLFRSDANVVPAVRAPPAKGTIADSVDNTVKNNNEEQSGGILDSIKDKMDEVTQLKKTLETPKKIPVE